MENVRAATYFSLIADEATDAANCEQLSIVLRFVDSENLSVREKFLGFTECKSDVSGNAIATNLVDILKNEWHLNLENLCGQAYDGAGAMAGRIQGVAARIMADFPKAVYTHCSSHVLNLCVVSSAKEADIRNMMDVAGSVARFFNNSPKRQLALDKHIDELHAQNSEASKRKKLKDLCKTRWVERHDAFEAFAELYVATVSCLEGIVESSSTWNRETVADAQSHLRALTEFKFLVALIITKNVLAYTKGLSVKLQGRYQDIIRAHSNIKSVTESLEDARKSVDTFHSMWFEEAKSIASELNIDPSMPRLSSRQRHRANPLATSPTEYFKLVVTIPLLDHLITELNQRFSEHNEKAIEVLTLLPPTVCSMTSSLTKDSISGFLSLYINELPSPSTLNTELHSWHVKCRHDREASNACNTVTKALKEADQDFFPNVHILLKIAATHPVTSCECERSISKLRLVKSKLRTTMGEDRLNGLALMYAHPDINLNIDSITDAFARLHPRRMKLSNIINE